MKKLFMAALCFIIFSHAAENQVTKFCPDKWRWEELNQWVPEPRMNIYTNICFHINEFLRCADIVGIDKKNAMYQAYKKFSRDINAGVGSNSHIEGMFLEAQKRLCLIAQSQEVQKHYQQALTFNEEGLWGVFIDTVRVNYEKQLEKDGLISFP